MLKTWMVKMMGPLMSLLSMTCRDTSPIISEMMDHRVSAGKYWRARIHLAICRVCRYYKNQLQTLTHLSSELAREDGSAGETVVLSEEARSQMKKALKSP
ncbi:hypothetical protein UR09_00200 [Candidatus Nitromaritima sp. SCGC AAA799-A02]|nr:hypothetical protein UZ36_00195 [Candidatus Nitromaritima sp. SCGC AAA799-C22]KMP12741.1 hypothetical protein UR09_00200 [Candidatus Nitromaritima sp. SCGC AAA799-A02]